MNTRPDEGMDTYSSIPCSFDDIITESVSTHEHSKLAHILTRNRSDRTLHTDERISHGTYSEYFENHSSTAPDSDLSTSKPSLARTTDKDTTHKQSLHN